MKAKSPTIGPDGLTYWRCPRCKTWLPSSEFYTCKRSPNGLKSQCKRCHSESSIRTRDKDRARDANRKHMQEARAKDPERFRQREREASRKRSGDMKCRARYELNLAVRRGEVERPSSCSRCGTNCKPHGHHEDYSAPLEVVWLCPQCHADLHRGVWVVSFRLLP